MEKTDNYKTWVEISGDALKNNILIARKRLMPHTKLLAVIKSNSYGHGLVETAKIFSRYDVDWLGVDNIDDAIILRRSGIKNPILVLGLTSSSRFKEAAKNNLRLTLYNDLKSDLSWKRIPFHIKIDTGMSRQGILISDLARFLKKLPPGINIEGVFTHFANADSNDRSYPDFQFGSFLRAMEIFKDFGIQPEIYHASATTGFLTMPKAQLDMVRLGVILYGLWPSIPFAEKFKRLGIRNALTWKTRVVQIKNIKQNTPVGYGITEKVKKDTKIAVLPVGYYDGYDRGLSSIGEVLIGGRRCKVLGRISMNLMVVDVSKAKNPKIWDEVVLIGRQGGENITAEELADKIETISYEIVSRINPLLPRIYI